MRADLPEYKELEELEQRQYDKQFKNYKKGVKEYKRENYCLAHFYFAKADDVKDAKKYLDKVEHILHAIGFFRDGKPKKARKYAKKHGVYQEVTKALFKGVGY